MDKEKLNLFSKALEILSNGFRLFLPQARIYPDPEGIAHDEVRDPQIARDPVTVPGLTHLVETRVFGQISGEQHPGLDSTPLQKLNDLIPGKRRVRFHRQQKAEPAGIGVGRRLRQNEELLQVLQPVSQ